MLIKDISSRVIYLAVASVGAMLFICSLIFSLEPWWTLVAACAVPTLVFGMAKYPTIFIPPLIFIGQFKEEKASTLSMTDPTSIVLILLYTCLLINILIFFSRYEGLSLEKCFAGQGKQIAGFLFFALAIATSFLYTQATQYGWEKLLKFFGISSVLFFAPLILIKNEKDFRRFATVTIGFAIILAVKILLGVIHPVNAMGTTARDITRIGPGQLLGVAALIVLFCKFVAGRIGQLMAVVGLPLLIAALVASTARGPILAFVFVSLVSILFLRQRVEVFSTRSARLAVVLFTIAAFGGSLYWLQQTAAESKFQVKKAELLQLVQGSGPAHSVGTRLSFYRSAVVAFSQKPLMGWGLGGWSVYQDKVDQRDYPHNLFLEIAVEQGLIGVAAMVCFFLTVFAAVKKIVRTHRLYAFLLPVVGFSLLVTMFSGDINDNRALWLWCGVVLAVTRMLTMAHRPPYTPSPIAQTSIRENAFIQEVPSSFQLR